MRLKCNVSFEYTKNSRKIIVIIEVLKGYLEKNIIVFSDFLNFVNIFQFRSAFVLKYTFISETFNYRYENLNDIISLEFKKSIFGA